MRLHVHDASVVVKVLVPERGEQDTERAVALWQRVLASEVAVLQPPHWLAEVAAALSRLSPSTAAVDAVDLREMRLRVADRPAVYRRGCEMAVELQHHLFDTLYHAVALEAADALLVTADEKYFTDARSYGRIVLLRDCLFAEPTG